jgi:cell wall-associated NlpC family hydrolase
MNNLADFESAQRQAVISEAESWIGTPFHHQGRVKGRRGGVDCAMLLLEVFRGAGVITDDRTIPYYSQQWHLHRSDEKYLEMILAFGAREITTPQPGDLAIWKVGRAFSHGAIVVLWPEIIHAVVDPINACVRDNALRSTLNLTKYPVKFFTPWRKAE